MRSSLAALLMPALLLAEPGVPAAQAAPGCDGSYTVRQGDTLSAVATRCGSTVEALLGANPGLADPGQISIGQELTVPGRQDGAAEAKAPEPELHTVEPGDSMAGIAAALGIPLDALLGANEGVDPRALQPGQKLRLPDRAAGTPEAEAVQPGGAAEAGTETGGTEGQGEAGDADGPSADDATPEGEATDAASPAPPEPLTLEGRVRKGAECPVLMTPEGVTYGLVSQTYGFTPGDYVAIEGAPVEMSFCGQARTLRVTSMRSKPAPER